MDEMPVIEQFTRELPVRLTDDEKRQRGHDLARAEQELQDFNDRERKARLAELKAKETDIRARITKLSSIVVTGTEIRQVACRAEADFKNGRAFLFRNDTGERVGDRALSENERQPSLLPAGTEAVRASECGHLTAKQDGVIPKFCASCRPDEQDPMTREPLRVIDATEPDDEHYSTGGPPGSDEPSGDENPA